jgi:hypothetical protein
VPWAIRNMRTLITWLITVFIPEMVRIIIELGRQLLAEAGRQIRDNLIPRIVEWFRSLPGKIAAVLGDKIVDVIVGPFNRAALETVGESVVPDLINDIVGYFDDLPRKIGTALVDLKNKIILPFQDAAEWLNTTFAEWLVKFIEWGKGIVENLTEPLNTLIDKISGPLQTAWEWLQSFLNNWLPRIKTIGTNLITDFVNGMIEWWNTTGITKIQELGTAIFDTFKGALGIQSPSAKMLWAGQMSGEGFVLGLRMSIDPARRAAEELARAALPPGTTLGGSIGVWRAPGAPLAAGDNFASELRQAFGSMDTALAREIRALRGEVRNQAERDRTQRERLSEEERNEFARLSPRMRRDILDMAKNDPSFARRSMQGTNSESRRSTLSGSR